MMFLTGFGYDIHRLEAGASLKLAGIEIPAEYKIVAHSDGDIVYHALAQAIFSALGEDDIGTFFPDNKDETLSLNSKVILNKALEEMKKRNLVLNNVVIAIVLEKPKLKEYKHQIKKKLADELDLEERFIAIHANTSERVGPIGESQAIACFCNLSLKDR